MPLPPLPHECTARPGAALPDEARDRVLLLLALLAREAGLPLEQVDGPRARATVARGMAADAPPRRAPRPGGVRPWMCRHRWAAVR